MIGIKHFPVVLLLFAYFQNLVEATASQSKFTTNEHSHKREAHHNMAKRQPQPKHRNQKKDTLKVVASESIPKPLSKTTAAPAAEPEVESAFSPPLPESAVDTDLLGDLYPDVRSCYDGIPRIYEKFARERLNRRLDSCLAEHANTTSICHKLCILLNLEFLSTYTVSIIETDRRQRRYKINKQDGCGHNPLGQDLLGIDTKIFNHERSLMHKKEKELYFQKVNQLGIRNYELDPFKLKFATVNGEDIIDERLEAQMNICRLYDFSTDDHDCMEFTSSEVSRLTQLIECMEKALAC